MYFRATIRKFSPVLTAYLLLVSVGVPLNRVYCMCVDATWITLAATDVHACPHDADVAEFTLDTPVISCHGAPAEAATDCANGDCGSSDPILEQLDLDFTEDLAKKAVVTGVMQPAIMLVVSSHNMVSRTFLAAAPIRGPAPPPLPFGRALCVAHQTFLL